MIAGGAGGGGPSRGPARAPGAPRTPFAGGATPRGCSCAGRAGRRRNGCSARAGRRLLVPGRGSPGERAGDGLDHAVLQVEQVIDGVLDLDRVWRKVILQIDQSRRDPQPVIHARVVADNQPRHAHVARSPRRDLRIVGRGIGRAGRPRFAAQRGVEQDQWRKGGAQRLRQSDSDPAVGVVAADTGERLYAYDHIIGRRGSHVGLPGRGRRRDGESGGEAGADNACSHVAHTLPHVGTTSADRLGPTGRSPAGCRFARAAGSVPRTARWPVVPPGVA